MKKYKTPSDGITSAASEPAVAYSATKPTYSVNRFPIEEKELTGKPWGEVYEELGIRLSEFYGVDFLKLNRMIASGTLNENDLTNELLNSPKFKYEPYPGFKPIPLPDDFVHDPLLIGVLEDEK